jgi:EAL domain-containing protein (putative c-di-GMP-specific phosphodiesterase class I)
MGRREMTNAAETKPTTITADTQTASSGGPTSAPLNPEAHVWVLYGHLGDAAGPQRIQVLSQPFTIGRNSENTIRVSNTTVSGSHAELLSAGDELLLRDRNSTNGTLLNGRRIQTVEALRDGDILHFGNVMFTVQRESQSLSSDTVTSDDATAEAIAQVQFNTLMSRPGIEPCFQPIVDLATGHRIGFEVLSRSQFVGLETPDKMFRIAAQRTSEAALSRVCRLEGMRASVDLDSQMKFYLNTHPAELNDNDLLDSLQDIRERHPEAAIVLEVHESGVTSVDYLKRLRAVLNDLGIELAYDDFGAGQARLTELIEVPPDVLKFDVKLVQGLPTANQARRSTVSGLIQIVRDLNVVPLAEGIETQEEADICRELGFELAQGYLFGRGERASKWIAE